MGSNDRPASIPIACSLSTEAAATRLEQWAGLRALATSTSAIDSGVRITFPVDLTGSVQQLAAAEQACCAFLRLTTTVDDDECTLDITADDPDAAPIIAMLAGLDRP